MDQLDHQDPVDQEDLVEETIHTIQTTTTVEEVVVSVWTADTTVVELIVVTHPTITVVEETIHTIHPTITVVEETIHTTHPTITVEEAPVEEEAPVDLINQLTGSQEVRFHQSKTKVNAVAAGHSQPLEISLPEELSNTTLPQLITPSNNSLIAQDLSVTMDAVVELWTLLSSMLKLHHSRPQPTTLTKLLMVPACTPHPKELELFLVTLTSKKTVSVP
jgi:acyl-CoA hydrolase